jgi:hypothetical protein
MACPFQLAHHLIDLGVGHLGLEGQVGDQPHAESLAQQLHVGQVLLDGF